jgi:hypothetical protein
VEKISTSSDFVQIFLQKISKTHNVSWDKSIEFDGSSQATLPFE